jgi:hypothetical protein
VRNEITERVLGAHPSYERALRQLRALYVHVPEARRGGLLSSIKNVPPEDEIYLRLSEESYKPKENRVRELDGYIYDYDLSTKRTAVYVDKLLKTVIIAHRGTVDKSDLVQDGYLVAGLLSLSSRFKNALDIIKNVMLKYPAFSIANTGHSLGGKIAVELGKELPIETKVVAFNPGSSITDIGEYALCSANPSTDQCKKLRNQKIYSIAIDPIAITSLIHPGHVAIKKSSLKFNPHTLKNYTNVFRS